MMNNLVCTSSMVMDYLHLNSDDKKLLYFEYNVDDKHNSNWWYSDTDNIFDKEILSIGKKNEHYL